MLFLTQFMELLSETNSIIFFSSHCKYSNKSRFFAGMDCTALEEHSYTNEPFFSVQSNCVFLVWTNVKYKRLSDPELGPELSDSLPVNGSVPL